MTLVCFVVWFGYITVSPVIRCSAAAFPKLGSVVGLAQGLFDYPLRSRSGGKGVILGLIMDDDEVQWQGCLVVFFWPQGP